MGEILLDVEKRNVKHFEVSTPYLAAVVKGTQFSVTVDETGSNVKVLRGKVEVANLRTGQFVLVKPGQSAHIETSKNNSPASGLILKGTGEKEKIQKGSAKKQRVKPLKTNQFRKLKQNQANKTKLKSSKIKKAASKSIRGKIKNSKIKLGSKPLKQFRKNKITKTRHKKIRVKRMRIGKAIGQVKLNVFKSTNGLSRSHKFANLSNKGKKKRKSKATFWNKTNGANNKTISSSVTQGNSVASNTGNNGNGNGKQWQ